MNIRLQAKKNALRKELAERGIMPKDVLEEKERMNRRKFR